MVRAWFMDDDTTHPKDEHHQNPPHFISLEEVFQVTGVEYHQVCVVLQKFNLLIGIFFKISDGYSEADIQLLKNLINTHKTVHEIKVDDFTDADLKRFYTEHCHSDDEMRLVLEGCGYYDFRDMYERWIRIEMVIGDLLVIPGGCYHRFTVDNKV